MTVSVNISKTLMDITGEPRAEIAILVILNDAIEHRIEKIKLEIKQLEEKYHMTFEEFREKFNMGGIPESYSYYIEEDYLGWEGLISRLSRYKTLLSNLL
ncbi:MAG: hypothetical protein HY754_08060 [Nitrospirae bacterium]|nr:hypothetical protein [Nitrospirota bacterium]